MSTTEKLTDDLRIRRLVMHNLKETVNEFQSRAMSILTLGEQWRSLHDDFATVDKSLESRVKNLQAMECENEAIKNRLENSLMEDELRKKNLDLEESFLAERVKVVEIREKSVKEECETVAAAKEAVKSRELKVKKIYSLIERKRSEIDERSEILVAEGKLLKRREKDLKERFEAVKLKEKEVGERFEGFEVREKRLGEQCREVEVKEKRLRKQCKVLELKEEDFNVLSEGLKLKKLEVGERLEELKTREKQFSEQCQGLEVREKRLNEQCHAMEVKEKLFRGQCEVLDSKEMEVAERLEELKTREKQFSEKRQALEVREKRLNEQCQTMEVKEKLFRKQCEVLEIREKSVKELYERLEGLKGREKNFSEQCQGLEVREKRLNKQCNAMEVKQKQFREQCKVLELKEEEFNVLSEGLKLKKLDVCERFEELKTREKQFSEKCQALEVREKQLNEQCHAMEVKEKQFREQCKVLESKEMEFKALCEGLKLKDEEVNSMGNEVDRRVLRLEQDRKDFDEKQKEMDELYSVLELREQEMNDRSNILELKEEEVKGKCLGLELKEEINEKCEGLDVKEKQIQEDLAAVELKESEINTFNRKLDFRESVLSVECIEMEEEEVNKGHDALVLEEWQIYECCKMLEKDINECFQELEKEEEQINIVHNNINDFDKGVELKGKELKEDGESEDEQVDNQDCHSEEPKRRKNDGNCSASPPQEQELSNNKIASSSLSEEPPDSMEPSLSSSVGGGIYSLCQNMDADAMKSYLIEHVNEQNLLQEMILDALRLAPDSAKLVVDVHKYPSKDQSIAFKNSCIFLLEQLMKLSPPINSDVKDEALSLAQNWMAWLKGGSKDVDSFGYLQFIAAFKLTMFFSADELISLFSNFYCGKIIYRQEQQAHLCHTLGLSEKIPGFIKSRIKKKKWLSAVKLICVFNLECDFSPIPLLQAHLAFIEERAIDRKKDGTPKSKYEAVCMELHNIQELYKWITNFKLELKFPPDYVLSRIKNLEKEKEAMGSQDSQLVKKCSSISCEETRLKKCPRVEKNVPPTAPLIRAIMTHSANPHITPDVQGTTCISNSNIVGSENRAPFPQPRRCKSHGYTDHVSPNAHHPHRTQRTMPMFKGPRIASMRRPPCPPPMRNSVGLATNIVPRVQHTWQQGTMPQSNGRGYEGFPHLGSGLLGHSPNFSTSSFYENQQA